MSKLEADYLIRQEVFTNLLAIGISHGVVREDVELIEFSASNEFTVAFQGDLLKIKVETL